ncbi:MAG: glucosamine-6-phosphate deaminase [Balneolaceae bacterium]
MDIEVFDSKENLGRESARRAAGRIAEAIQKKGTASIILATGASQFEILDNLIETKEVDWSRVVLFHLDEYVGMPESHPASFRKFLKERFIKKIPPLKAAHLVKGDADDPAEECRRLNRIISEHPVDVALVGIGENGHLAFNDPPADFETEDPFIVVELDDVCRRQQMGEGWFDTFEEVPEKAISMSVKQIMKSDSIVCSVPDRRKAEAVKNCLHGDVSRLHPASVLQKHADCLISLDTESASLLPGFNNS